MGTKNLASYEELSCLHDEIVIIKTSNQPFGKEVNYSHQTQDQDNAVFNGR